MLSQTILKQNAKTSIKAELSYKKTIKKYMLIYIN